MAEEKKLVGQERPTTTTTAGPVKPTERPAGRPRRLTPAAESGDPAVHQLLAEKQTAELNGDEDAVKAAADQLAELGYQ